MATPTIKAKDLQEEKQPKQRKYKESQVVARYRYVGKAQRTFCHDKKDGGDIIFLPDKITDITAKQMIMLSKSAGWRQMLQSFEVQEIDIGAVKAQRLAYMSLEAAQAAIASCHNPKTLVDYARYAYSDGLKKAILERVEEMTRELESIRGVFPVPQVADSVEENAKAEDLKTAINQATEADYDWLVDLSTNDGRITVKSVAIAKLRELGLWNKEHQEDSQNRKQAEVR